MIKLIGKFLSYVLLLIMCKANALTPKQQVTSLNDQQFNAIKKVYSDFLTQAVKPTKHDWSTVGITMTEDESSITLEGDNKRLFAIGKVIINKQVDPTVTPLMLQAPHQFYDRHTGRIVRALSQDKKVAISLFNTVQRYSTSNADLTHQKLTLFSAFSEVFLQQFEQGKIVQIHGFSGAKRKTHAAKYADIIISNTTNKPGNYLRQLQGCYSNELGLVTRIFGYDVFELGGTKNKLAQHLKGHNLNRFTHIELSASVRENYSDTAWIRNFAKCL